MHGKLLARCRMSRALCRGSLGASGLQDVHRRQCCTSRAYAEVLWVHLACRMSTDFRGRKYAEQVQCARVYHINVVLRIRTSTQDKVRNRAYREKSMQIQR